MNVNKILLGSVSIILGLFFTGCSEKQLEVREIKEERVYLNLQEPEQIKLKNVKFYIITEDNFKTVFAELKAKNTDTVIIGLSDDDYSNMSENLVEIQNYISKQKNIIFQYKQYYESNIKEKNVTNKD